MTPATSSTSLRARLAGVLALALIFCCALAANAGAATITVDNDADTATPNACTAAAGDCTMRGAIAAVNSGAGGDTIDFAAGVTELDINAPFDAITKSAVINGAGNVEIVGTGVYAGDCDETDYAFDTSAAAVQILGLAIHDVCGRAIYSTMGTPTIHVGPRRADNTVPISGSAADGSVEIFRSDVGGEGAELFKTGLTASGGGYSWLPVSTPSPSEKFTAIVTSPGGRTSNFSSTASAPSDLSSPTLQRAVAISNNTVRLDFSEPISGGVNGMLSAFALAVGGANREITNVGVDGSSVYLVSITTPWKTGEAGSVALTGAGRVADIVGNEVLGTPSVTVYAGPGELSIPTITKLKVAPSKFCQRATSKCNKRKQTYVYFTVNKPSRVVFTVRRAKGSKFVVQYVHLYEAGAVKSKLTGTMNGRTLPATNLTLEVTAQDNARNFSAPVKANFKTVTRNKSL
ncbi:MAG: hypothetical protein QM648_10450 [Solirubrobacterales bacterium]